jgi:hypothetical protein
MFAPAWRRPRLPHKLRLALRTSFPADRCREDQVSVCRHTHAMTSYSTPGWIARAAGGSDVVRHLAVARPKTVMSPSTWQGWRCCLAEDLNPESASHVSTTPPEQDRLMLHSSPSRNMNLTLLCTSATHCQAGHLPTFPTVADTRLTAQSPFCSTGQAIGATSHTSPIQLSLFRKLPTPSSTRAGIPFRFNFSNRRSCCRRWPLQSTWASRAGPSR